MQVVIITHSTAVDTTNRYVSVKQNFDDAVESASVLMVDRLSNGTYAGVNDFVLDVVEREEEFQPTIVRVIDSKNGEEYEAYQILAVEVN